MSVLDWALFGPSQLIAVWGPAGFVIGGLLIVAGGFKTLFDRNPIELGIFRKPAVFGGVLWIVFNAYEWQVQATTLPGAGSAFRIDLLVLVPILYVMTVASVYDLISTKVPKRNAIEDDSTDRSGG
jgi:hypothetical protein